MPPTCPHGWGVLDTHHGAPGVCVTWWEICRLLGSSLGGVLGSQLLLLFSLAPGPEVSGLSLLQASTMVDHFSWVHSNRAEPSKLLSQNGPFSVCGNYPRTCHRAGSGISATSLGEKVSVILVAHSTANPRPGNSALCPLSQPQSGDPDQAPSSWSCSKLHSPGVLGIHTMVPSLWERGALPALSLRHPLQIP